MEAGTAAPETTDVTAIARRYFQALAEHDLDAATACWHPGGTDRIVGMDDLTVPEGLRAFFAEIFGAFPDFRFEILSTTAEADRCAVRWAVDATFAGPGTFQGIAPNGARVQLECCDVVRVRDGLLVGNDAYLDGAMLARQIGMLPPRGSGAEQKMTSAFNLKTKVVSRTASGPEQIAEGVWVIRGGFPIKAMNVYLVRDGDGVLVFDAGIRAMTNAIAAAGAGLGGITRVVLGHGHADHRGAAPGLNVPVYCHPAEKADAEGDGGEHYFDYSKLARPVGFLMPRMLKSWDGGPVEIAGTVEEGDDVAGFRVIELPGHAPGLIGLWRESDRLALVSDCFYTLNPQTARKGAPRLPHRAFNIDSEQAQASIRKLAALEPAAAWAGHADPVTQDVREQLERAAATT